LILVELLELGIDLLLGLALEALTRTCVHLLIFESLLEHAREPLDILARLLVCWLLDEVREDQLAPGHGVIAEEGVEEKANLHHAVLEELVVEASEHFLRWKFGKAEVHVVQLLPHQRLELAQTRVPVEEVEGDADGGEDFEDVVGMFAIEVHLHHLHLV